MQCMQCTHTPSNNMCVSAHCLQVLLVASGGASLGRLPVMAVAFFFMLKSWLHSVRTLSQYSNCSMTHVEHTLDEREDHDNDEESSDGFHGADQAVPSMQ